MARNQPIDNWDTRSLTNMNNIFGSAQSFNQSIGNWDVGRVNNMEGMFHGAQAF